MDIACGYTIPITLFGIPPSPADHLKGMEIVGQAGFRAIELEFYDELVDAHRRDIKEMRAILSRYGMTVPPSWQWKRRCSAWTGRSRGSNPRL